MHFYWQSTNGNAERGGREKMPNIAVKRARAPGPKGSQVRPGAPASDLKGVAERTNKDPPYT